MTDPRDGDHVFKIAAMCSKCSRDPLSSEKREVTFKLIPWLQKKQEYPEGVLIATLSRYKEREEARLFSAVYRSLSRLAGCGRDAASQSAVERAASVERKEARARLPKQGCSDASLLRCAAPD